MKRFLELFTEMAKDVVNPLFLCNHFLLTVNKLKIGEADCCDHTEHDGKNSSDDRGRNGDEERTHF